MLLLLVQREVTKHRHLLPLDKRDRWYETYLITVVAVSTSSLHRFKTLRINYRAFCYTNDARKCKPEHGVLHPYEKPKELENPYSYYRRDNFFFTAFKSFSWFSEVFIESSNFHAKRAFCR